MNRASLALLACDVFAEEVAALAGYPEPWRASAWLEMGLHDHPQRLREAIHQKVAELEVVPGVDRVLLAYGLCGNGLLGIRAGRVPLVIPKADDCVALLLGSNDRRAKLLREKPSLYFYSPGWIRGGRVPGSDRESALRQQYTQRYPDDPELVDELLEADAEAFAHHDTAAYVDLTDNREAQSYCQGCARHLGWSFRRLPGDASWLRDLLAGDHEDPDRFLVVEPGQTIGLDPNAQLIAQTLP